MKNYNEKSVASLALLDNGSAQQQLKKRTMDSA
jgi:hypothetical protein